jgi:hypothetical protein
MRKTAKKPASIKQLITYLNAHPEVSITFPNGFRRKDGWYRFDGFMDSQLCWTNASGRGFSIGLETIRCLSKHCPVNFHETGTEFMETGFVIEFAGNVVQFEYVE